MKYLRYLLETQLLEGSIEEAHKLGYDTDHILYHGSKQRFNKFDRTFSKTAEHIYTTPDPMTASNYGGIVYEVAPKIKKLADLIDDYDAINFVADEIKDNFVNDIRHTFKHKNDMEKLIKSPEYHQSVKEIASQIIHGFDSVDDFEYEDAYEELTDKLHDILAKQEATEFLQSGKTYDYDYKGKMQDEIMEVCFRNGYNVVRFIDPSTMGESESYVFDDPSDLYIIGEHQ